MVKSYIIDWIGKDIYDKFYSNRHVFYPGEEENMEIFVERLKASENVCKITKITTEIL